MARQGGCLGSHPLPKVVEWGVSVVQARYALVYFYYYYAGDALWELDTMETADTSTTTTSTTTSSSISPTRVAWLEKTDECTWRGVTCNAAHQVTGLHLDRAAGFVLKRPFGDFIVEQSLQYFSLTHLVVSNQECTGRLSSLLMQQQELRVLDMHQSRLTGSIPSTLPLHLERLDLRQNNLTGTVPLALQQCRHLTELRLAENPSLTGPLVEWMTHWPNLQVLQLGHSGMTGSLLDNDDNNDTDLLYQHVVELSLPVMAWTGTLPRSLARASNLKILNLAEPRQPLLLGSIPDSFQQLTRLEALRLESTGLTGTLPPQAVAAWSHLNEFNVHNNYDLRGTLPTELGLLTRLDTLLLSRTALSGSIPTELGACTLLRRAEFERTQLTGSMPAQVCAIRMLHLGADCDFWNLMGQGGDETYDVPLDCPADCCTHCTVQF